MESEDQEIQRTLSHNVIVSLFTKILYLVTRLIVPPFILMYLSLEEYGIWSYCFIFLSYLGLSVHGITNVYVRFGAVFAAHQDIEKINKLVSTGLIIVSSICLLLIPILWCTLPLLLSFAKLSPELFHSAVLLIFSTMLIFMADLTVGVFAYILQSLQKIAIERVIWTVSFIIETLCILGFLYIGWGLYGLLAAFAVRVLLSVTLNIIVCFKAVPGLALSWRYFDKSMITLFTHFGGIVQLTGFLGIANRSLEKILAGVFVGTNATGLYEVGEKFPIMAISLPETLNAIFLPTTSHFHAKEMKSKILAVYLKGSRVVNMLTGLMMGFLASFSLPLIVAWLGSDEKYQMAALILTFFTIAYQMDVLTGPASAIYRSIAEPKKELVYGCCQFVFVLLCAALGFYFFGYSMMVINVCVVSMMVLSALVYIAYSNRFLGVKHADYFFQVLLPGLLPYGNGFIWAWLTQNWFEGQSDRWVILWHLLAALVLYTLTTGAFMLFAICTREERAHVKEQCGHFFRFSRR